MDFEDYFQKLLHQIELRLGKDKKRPIQLLMVPSLRDAHFAHCILPQPPFPYVNEEVSTSCSHSACVTRTFSFIGLALHVQSFDI